VASIGVAACNVISRRLSKIHWGFVMLVTGVLGFYAGLVALANDFRNGVLVLRDMNMYS
jgi:hypothetical protein